MKIVGILIKLTTRYLYYMIQFRHRNRLETNDHSINYYIMDNLETLFFYLISWVLTYSDQDLGLRYFLSWATLLVIFGSDFYLIWICDQRHFHLTFLLHDCNVTP